MLLKSKSLIVYLSILTEKPNNPGPEWTPSAGLISAILIDDIFGKFL